MSSLNSFLKFILSVLLLPVCYAAGRSLLETIISLNRDMGWNGSWIYFVCGLAAYLVFQAVFFKPMRTYIFGHELTHAMASILSGGKVKSFKVGKNSGNVTLTKTNTFITLAPYFVPIYSLFLIIVYWAAKRALGANLPYGYFLFLFGATLAFHLSLTFFAIKHGQSDLRRYGVIYSLIIIFILNCVVLNLILAPFFPVKPLHFFGSVIRYSGRAFADTYYFSAPLAGKTMALFQNK
jgi:hypothetical protein